MRTIKIATICLAILFTNCKKEETTPVVSLHDCITFPEVKNSGLLNFKGYAVVDSDTTYSYPVFSPYNPNEMIYYREIFWHNEEWTQMGTEKKLFKYNLATGEKILLLQGKEATPNFAWSVKGQIIYPTFNLILGSMNDDGTGKTTFMGTNGHYTSFCWNKTGTKLIISGNLYPPKHSIMVDLEKNTADTFNYSRSGKGFMYAYGDWSANDSIISFFSDSLYTGLASWNFADTSMNAIVKYAWKDNPLMGNGCWHPDNITAYFSRAGGIYKARNGHITQLKEHCDSKSYGSISVSPDGKKLLYTRRNYIKLDEHTLRNEGRIYIMNIDGSGEKQLVLD